MAGIEFNLGEIPELDELITLSRKAGQLNKGVGTYSNQTFSEVKALNRTRKMTSGLIEAAGVNAAIASNPLVLNKDPFLTALKEVPERSAKTLIQPRVMNTPGALQLGYTPLEQAVKLPSSAQESLINKAAPKISQSVSSSVLNAVKMLGPTVNFLDGILYSSDLNANEDEELARLRAKSSYNN